MTNPAPRAMAMCAGPHPCSREPLLLAQYTTLRLSSKLIADSEDAGNMPGVLLGGGTVTAGGHAAQQCHFAIADVHADVGGVGSEGRVGVKHSEHIARDVAVAAQSCRGCCLLGARIQVQNGATATEPAPARVGFRGFGP